MLRIWAATLQRTTVRILLFAVGLLATIVLGPMLIMDLFSGASDEYQFLGWSVVDAGGLAGIVGAWLRVLVLLRIGAARRLARTLGVIFYGRNLRTQMRHVRKSA